MNQVKRMLVWLRRIGHCRGFGIQSPTDYAFVRYVVNEHWPYYAYEQLDNRHDDWLTRKLGRLYLRLANWRQPHSMAPDAYQPYWQAGCRKTQFAASADSVELARVEVDDAGALEALLRRCDPHSVLVVENIWRNWPRWHAIEQDTRVGTTFDLYYCGIVLFEKNRYHHHYTINF